MINLEELRALVETYLLTLSTDEDPYSDWRGYADDQLTLFLEWVASLDK